ncbi:MAG TPA: SDR family NAD(P)-dependent oxidoreductase [Paracoccaceae bacterium]|nr:SDR family NAD(P)-dependent oxidoreductase [Paracoccaceae bacterium]
MNRVDLEGRVAAVTGGAQGIGRAVAERLVASGATVVIWDRDAALAEETAGAIGAEAVAVDMTDLASVEAAERETTARHGRLDVLVNNAGIAGPNVPLADYPTDAWAAVMRLNVDGVFHGCRAVVPGMVERGYGRIVNVASVAGKEGNPNASAYSASKAAVIAITKSLGKELAGHDIGVNCVTPAAARTAIFDQMTEAHIQFMLSKIPRGRFVEVGEVAGMVAWLASEEMRFATGAVFDVSGGRATY